MTRTRPSVPANERLKQRFGDVMAFSLISATAVHFLVFQMWPPITVPDWSTPAEETPVVVDITEIAIPAPPPALDRPALPIAVPDVAPTTTIQPVSWDEARELPAPPLLETRAATARRADFFPYDVPPRLENAAEYQRALARSYPRALRDAGVGGTVVLVAHISEEGRVLEARVGETSGYEGLDVAALDLVDVMRFTPALNRDVRVAVWVSLPIDFRIR